MKLDNLWVEKYRPTLEDGLGEIFATYRNTLHLMKDDENFQLTHALFYSPEAGTGKTSLAFAIAKELGYQVHSFNASTKRERNIDFIEEEIIPLATNGFAEQIILLDEADRLTAQAQDALKGVIENATCVFILTCNDLSKITPYLKSRCLLHTFPVIDQYDVVVRLVNIGIEEGVVFNPVELERIAEYHKGDLRNSINYMQSISHLSPDEQSAAVRNLSDASVNAEKFLRACMVECSVATAVPLLNSTRARKSIRDVFTYGMNTKASAEAKAALIEASVVAERDLIMGVDPDIALHAFANSLCLGVYMEKGHREV